MNKICGIYEFINILTGDVYVGQSVDIKRRYNDHVLRGGDSLIDKAIKEYGIDNFEFIIYKVIDIDGLTKKEIKEILNIEEIKRIKELNCCVSISGHGYNKSSGGGGSSNCKAWNFGISCIGHPCSEETKKKIGDKNRGRKRTPEQRENMKGPFSEEHCKHLSEAMKGRKAWNKGRNDYITDEAYNKMIEGGIRGGQINGDKTRGKQRSKEVCNNISIGTKKSFENPERYNKCLETNRNPDRCKKISNKRKKWWTPEKKAESSRRQTGGFYMTNGIIEKPIRVIKSKQPELFAAGWYRCHRDGRSW